LAALFSLVSMFVASQGANAALIGGVEAIRSGDASELVIEFTEPMRYLRHSPERRADTLVIQLDPVVGVRPDLPFGDLREFRRLSPGNPSGAREVHLDGSFSRGFALEVRFAAQTHFTVEPGGDPHRLVVRIHARPGAKLPRSTGARFAIQIGSRPLSQGVPEVSPEALPSGSRLYTLVHRKGGQTWVRARVGFFDTKAAAETARELLARRYPDAWVVRATRAEQTTAARTALVLPAGETRTGASSEDTAAPPAPRPIEATDSAPVDPRVEAWMQSARDHLTAGQPKKAIPLLTKLTSLPPHPHSREAKELLGVARERNRQIAHAKAEYEEYLALYPSGEATLRVSQRLDALLTAAKPKREALPEVPSASRLQYDLFGTLSTYYRFDRRQLGDLDPITTDSSLNTDAFAGGRLRLAAVDVKSEFSASYLSDFLEGGDDEARIRTAFVELRERGGPWSGVVGRQSPRGAGIIERYDGIGLRYALGNGVGISATGGLPVNIFDSNEVSVDRGFAGVNVDFQLADRPISGEVFAIYYDAQGFVDRVGIGTELRYIGRDRSLTALIDFDAYYQSLNTAFATGFLQLTETTHVNLLIDHRNSPILRSSNALIGQNVSGLDRLPFSDSEIRRFAEDRTSRSTLGSIGVTHRLGPRLQLSGDFSVAYFGSTSDSGGVLGSEAYGPDFTVYGQLLANDLLVEGDISLIGLRIQRGEPTNLLALVIEGRYRALDSLRVIPRFDLDHRENRGNETLALTPGLRVDYRFRSFTLEAGCQVFWEPNLSGQSPGDERGYTLFAGIRYNF
jgi:hypothetical protein